MIQKVAAVLCFCSLALAHCECGGSCKADREQEIAGAEQGIWIAEEYGDFTLPADANLVYSHISIGLNEVVFLRFNSDPAALKKSVLQSDCFGGEIETSQHYLLNVASPPTIAWWHPENLASTRGASGHIKSNDTVTTCHILSGERSGNQTAYLILIIE